MTRQPSDGLCGRRTRVVWMLEGNLRLGSAARAALANPTSSLIIPATAIAEACWVVARGKTSLPDWRDVPKAVRADNRIRISNLDAHVIETAMTLPTHLEMHDAQIIATSLVEQSNGHDVKILTRDRMITDSGLLPVVW